MGKHSNDNNNVHSKTKEEKKSEEMKTDTASLTEGSIIYKENKHVLSHERNGVSKSKRTNQKVHLGKSESDQHDEEQPSTQSLLAAAADDNGEKPEKETADESADNPHPGLPVDRGWAWVVMIAQFLICFLIVGYGRALSIFFLEFLDMFDVPATTATIAFGIMTAFFGIGNVLVSHVLMTRFSTRAVVVVGALMNTAGIASTALAPSMLFVIIAHGFVGFSHSLMYIPGVTLLGHYFRNRRSLAIAVSSTGFSLSAIILPAFTEFLITSYGTRGALLLVAGVELQCTVAACLFRPVSWYTRKKRPPVGEERNRPQSKNVEKADFVSNVSTGSKKEGGDDTNTKDTTARLLDKIDEHGNAVDILLQQQNSCGHILSSSLPEKSFLTNQPGLFLSEERLNLSNHKNRTRTCNRQQTCSSYEMLSSPRLEQVSGSLKTVSALTTSVVDIYGSTMSITAEGVLQPSSNERGKYPDPDDGKTKTGGWCSRCVSVMSDVIDLSLFKNWLFLLILVFVPLGFTGMFIGFYFPSLGVENGLPRPQAALLVTVAGGVDLVSRLVVGYLADLQLIKRTHIVVICMALTGLTCFFCKFYTNFSLLAMFAVIFGLVGGVCSNLFVVIIIDLMGLALMGKVIGLMMLVNSAFTSLNHVLVGALVDMSGTFVIVYNYAGACLFASSLVLLMEPLARRLEAKRVSKLACDSSREPVNA